MSMKRFSASRSRMPIAHCSWQWCLRSEASGVASNPISVGVYDEDIGAELIGKTSIVLGFYGSGRALGCTVRGATVTLGRHWKLESSGEICEGPSFNPSIMIWRCFPVQFSVSCVKESFILTS